MKLITWLAASLCVIASNAMAQSTLPIGGSFVQAEYLDPQTRVSQLQLITSEMNELDMDTMVVQSTLKKSCATQASGYQWVPGMPDAILDILEQASKKNIKVYMGLGYFTDWWSCTPYYANTGATIEQLTPGIDAIVSIVGGSPYASAFAGWYFPDEPDFANPDDAEFAAVKAHYQQISAFVRSKFNKPLLISPYLYTPPGTQPLSAQGVASRLKTFSTDTGIDIYAVQDSVGTGAKDVGWGREQSVGDYYYYASQAIGRDHLWSVNELFDYGVTLSSGHGGAYLPASIQRINRQLSLASTAYVGKRLGWLPLTHMTALTLPSNGTFYGAARLKDAYKAIYGREGTMLVPAYSWATPPSSNYPDTGNKMFDTLPGDPKSFNSSSWVGVPAWQYPDAASGKYAAEIVMDFGHTSKIDWVATQMLNSFSGGIFLPDQMQIQVSPDGINWTVAGTYLPRCYPTGSGQVCSTTGESIEVRPESGSSAADDSEYVFSNETPLGLNSRYLKLRYFTTSGWLFFGEIEIVSKP
ncbi:DUF4434 domain-containing protein [Dyella sp. BiH032]|uniref:DUF4434 domain-containing protein n=1 Tax=Dyella sp. BiH032 TaxID=3075430 RepID=UPI002892DB17|nr:DUF4434 domain-containing protein [Dyella sp. BiH032]WNL48069.1 DUF4434 domain-containing protein [Dyella sp. BiH032]